MEKMETAYYGQIVLTGAIDKIWPGELGILGLPTSRNASAEPFQFSFRIRRVYNPK
jgi:hypothetical protein